MTQDAVLTIRLPGSLLEALESTAKFYGRSAPAQARLALMAHLRASALFVLANHPEVIEDELGPAADLNAVRAEVEASLDSLHQRAFRRATPAIPVASIRWLALNAW